MIRLVPAALAVALTGCSPYVYDSEINSFANSVDALRQARIAAIQATTTAALEYDVARWTADRPALELNDCDTLAAASKCQLIVPAPTGVENDIADARALRAADAPLSGRAYEAISVYIGGLRAVTNAADRDELDKQTGRLVGGICGLSANVALLSASGGASALVCGVSKLGGELIALSLDHRRYQALREAVHAADEPFKTLVPPLVNDLQRLLKGQLDEVQGRAELLRVALQSPNVSDYQTKLRSLLALEADLRRIGSVNFGRIKTEMLAAHAALVVATDSNDRQIGPIAQAVTNLADAVEPLIQTLQSLATGAPK